MFGTILGAIANAIANFFLGLIENMRRDQTNRDLGAATATGEILIATQEQVTEIRNDEERYSDLPRAELLRRLRERGHGG